MVTGASTADLALILLDARKGIVEQSRRHAFLTTLLRVPHLVCCVNKMDLVDWSEDRFQAIVGEFTEFATRLEIGDLTFIPISALHGDNVVERSQNMPWYGGVPLLYHLEHVHIASDPNLVDVRLPVQWVIRAPEQEYRAYAGMVASGTLRAGDEVMILPSARTARIEAIEGADGEIEEAVPGRSIRVRLDRQLDVSRGDMICRPHNQPQVTRSAEAQLAWLGDRPLQIGGRYALKHTTRWTRAIVDELRYRIDVNTLHRDQGAHDLSANEIGRVVLRTSAPLLWDPYRDNRATGSIILVDEGTNETVGAGMLIGQHG